jgi:hypothetical protein
MNLKFSNNATNTIEKIQNDFLGKNNLKKNKITYLIRDIVIGKYKQELDFSILAVTNEDIFTMNHHSQFNCNWSGEISKIFLTYSLFGTIPFLQTFKTLRIKDIGSVSYQIVDEDYPQYDKFKKYRQKQIIVSLIEKGFTDYSVRCLFCFDNKTKVDQVVDYINKRINGYKNPADQYSEKIKQETDYVQSQKIKQLKSLLNEGLITEIEFQQKRSEWLKSI